MVSQSLCNTLFTKWFGITDLNSKIAVLPVDFLEAVSNITEVNNSTVFHKSIVLAGIIENEYLLEITTLHTKYNYLAHVEVGLTLPSKEYNKLTYHDIAQQ